MGSSLVSSAAARSSPRDLQPTTALSLLYRRTIPPGWGRAGRSGGLGVVRRVGGGEEEADLQAQSGGTYARTPRRARRVSQHCLCPVQKQPHRVKKRPKGFSGKGLPCVLLSGMQQQPTCRRGNRAIKVHWECECSPALQVNSKA